MNKKYVGFIFAIIIVIGIIYGISHKKQVQDNTIIVPGTAKKIVIEKKVICKIGPEVESDWCKLPTGQRLLLSMTGDTVYDNGDYYSFSRSDTDQGVRLYKIENFVCSDHLEATSCDGSTKFILTEPGSKDFYNNILRQLNETYLQTRKDTDPM